jgi:hypothetical protein
MDRTEPIDGNQRGDSGNGRIRTRHEVDTVRMILQVISLPLMVLIAN